MRDIFKIIVTIESIKENVFSLKEVNILPKIPITSPEQFVPIHLALDYFPHPEILNIYTKHLENRPKKSKKVQEKVSNTFITAWLKEVTKNPLQEYREFIPNYNVSSNFSNIVLGTKLTKVGRSDAFLSRFGLLTSFESKFYSTLGNKQFESVDTYYFTFGTIYYLVVVKAKVLPLIATSLLLQQPLKLDTSDIQVFTINNPNINFSLFNQIKQTFPTLRQQQIEVQEVENEVMLKYLVGKQEEKTNEQLLETARKILEEETILA